VAEPRRPPPRALPGPRRNGQLSEPIRLTREQATAWRLARQHLDRRAPREAWLEVVSDIGGLHAQLASSAELTLWARVEGLEPGDVERALWEERLLVKTWAMRGTLHLLPADELATWQAALAARAERTYFAAVWLRNFGLTRERLEAVVDAIGEALDSAVLTREELAAEVARLTGAPELEERIRSGWGALLKPAAALGRLIFAPGAGGRVRFTRPDRWLPGWSPQDPAAGLGAVTRRFFAACGPADRVDYARWWGTDPAPAGRTMAGLGGGLVPVEVEGASAWMLRKDAEDAARAEPSPSVRLLPAFDQYVVTAPRQAEHLLRADRRDRVYRPQGWLSPVLLVDGCMMGTWRHERRGSRVAVRIEPFGRLRAGARGEAAREAESLARFLGGRLELTWSSASGGSPAR
jgi:hypothetical protein